MCGKKIYRGYFQLGDRPGICRSSGCNSKENFRGALGGGIRIFRAKKKFFLGVFLWIELENRILGKFSGVFGVFLSGVVQKKRSLGCELLGFPRITWQKNLQEEAVVRFGKQELFSRRTRSNIRSRIGFFDLEIWKKQYSEGSFS